MPGYIEQFKTFSPERQNAEIEDKIGSTYDKLIDTRAFAGIVAGSDTSEWEMDDFQITKIAINDAKKEIQADVAYTAYWNVPPEAVDPWIGDWVKGKLQSTINDNGRLRYNKLSGKTRWAPKDPKTSGKNAPVGSDDWFDYWLKPSRWKLSGTGSGALHAEPNGYHVAVVEYDSGWLYHIKKQWTNEEVDKNKGYSSELAVKLAALESLASILGSSP